MGQQPRACKASGYWSTWRRHLGDVLAAAADPLGANMADHSETCRNVLQHFGRILTQIAKLPTAARALRLGLMHVSFSRQVFGQWFAARNCARCRFDWRCHFGLADLQLFKAQLKLIDHRVQLLAAATELRTTQLGDHHFQALNLCPLGRDQSLQGLKIVRQGVGHESHDRMLLGLFSARQVRPRGRVLYELACANQCLPTASITAQPSATRCRWLLAARRSGLVPTVCKIDTSRRHPTTTI